MEKGGRGGGFGPVMGVTTDHNGDANGGRDIFADAFDYDIFNPFLEKERGATNTET